MSIIRIALSAAALALTIQSFSLAHVLHYAAILNGPSQHTPNASPGVGTALVTFNHDTLAMRVEVSFSGLLGTVTAANIHALTEEPLTGTADVATQVPTFPGFPSGVTSGDYDSTFSMAQASSYNPAFIEASGGTVSHALNALADGLDHGRTYLNIRTTMFPDGEIRGFLINRPGDFNHNLVVDAADYAVWRDSYGQTGEGMHADSNHDNRIDEADYDEWLRNFGRTGLDGGHHHAHGSFALAFVPEPGWSGLLIPILLLAGLARRFVPRW